MPHLPDKCSSPVEAHPMFDLLLETAAEQPQQLTHREFIVPTFLRGDLWK